MGMAEKAQGTFTIKSIEPDTVEDMLTYIYGGEIDAVEDKASKLLAAADCYDLKQLKKHCEEILGSNLNVGNCLDYLVHADLYSTDKLKPLVTRFLVENSRDVVTEGKWVKNGCEELLARSLSISNCLDYLILADIFSADKLKPVVIEFIVENSSDVVKQNNWKCKLTTFPKVFAEVFNAFVCQLPKEEK